MSVVRAVTGSHIAEVVLDRPDARNALSVEMCSGIVAAAYASVDLQEGLAAMADRRPPRFETR